MATLTYSAIKNIAFDRAQINSATDAPVSDTEFARHVNDAYSTIWNASGGRIKTVASATAWTSAQTQTNGVITGILTDIDEVLHVFASTTSGSTGTSSGDNELDRAELSMIQWLRKSFMTGTYDRPKVYAISRLATTTPASVNLVQLDVWPTVTNYYYPIIYNVQFTAIDSVTVTTPDVNDIESYDIALMTGMKLAQLVGRHDLVPGIAADISTNTQLILARKQSALVDAKQDK